MIHPVLRILLLPVFIAVVFFAYAYGSDAMPSLVEPSSIKDFAEAYNIPKAGVRSLVLLNLIFTDLFLVVGTTLLFSTLAVKVYREDALLVAILTALPIVAIRFQALLEPVNLQSFSSIASFALSAFEIGSFSALLCGGTWLLSRQHSSRPLKASEKEPPTIANRDA